MARYFAHKLVVVENGKEYTLAQPSDYSEWMCSCAHWKFQRKKCRHLYFRDALRVVEGTFEYNPSEGLCGEKYVTDNFRKEEWTDPEEAMDVMVLRELSGDKKESDKLLRKLKTLKKVVK